MKKMFRLLLLILFVYSYSAIMAQAQNIGRVAGKLMENGTKAPVGFASVGLFAAKDSTLVSGTTSAEDGQYAIENVAFGNYFLKVTLVSFVPKFVPAITLSASQPTLNLGTITVASSAKKLSEVEIVAQKDLVEYGLDKQV